MIGCTAIETDPASAFFEPTALGGSGRASGGMSPSGNFLRRLSYDGTGLMRIVKRSTVRDNRLVGDGLRPAVKKAANGPG